MDTEPEVHGRRVPSAYVAGLERARAIDPELADNYVAHTVIGDPLADRAIEDISSLPPEEASQVIRAAMNQDDEAALSEAPQSLRELFDQLESPPDWVDQSAFFPGIRMFHRNSQLVLGAFVGGTLVEGFSTNISKSFFITGRLRDQGVRRLKQNNRHMIEIFMPGGLERSGDGLKLSVRIRLVHAQLRSLLKNSDDWEAEEWGEPISAAHLGFAITAFSARLLLHLRNLGAVFNDEEREGFMAVWRYTGYLMGIPETILYKDEDEALDVFRIGVASEPPPELESKAMANSLISSSPLVIGIDDPEERRKLATYVFRVSRALIGNDLADQLVYPPSSTVGVLRLFRFQQQYRRILNRMIPGHAQSSNFSRFTSLLEASMFEEADISYRMPDHVHAEESRRW